MFLGFEFPLVVCRSSNFRYFDVTSLNVGFTFSGLLEDPRLEVSTAGLVMGWSCRTG